MVATNELTDREILLRAAEDQGHLGVLVKRYRTPLYNFVYRFVGDRETAEDIVQETFLRCLRHSHQYPAIEQVSTWLYTIAGNLAKTELRRRKRWHWIPISPSDDEQTTAFYEPAAKDPLPGEQGADGNRVKSLVVDAIEDLPTEFRAAVLLPRYERALVRGNRQDHQLPRRHGQIARQPGPAAAAKDLARAGRRSDWIARRTSLIPLPYPRRGVVIAPRLAPNYFRSPAIRSKP